jgi:hypothetical protein
MINELYPEIDEAGDLSNALNMEFEKINSSLRVAVDEDLNNLPFAYAMVENGKKYSQIYLAAETKLYLLDYWRDGVCLANGSIDNIRTLVESLNFWLSSDINTTILSDKFKFVKVNAKSKAFDEHREVEYTWHEMLNDSDKSELSDFIKLAIKDEVLSTLFPFTSVGRLCFSQCTGYPYTYDTPIVIPIPFENGIYEIRSSNDAFIGKGIAIDALEIVKANLPNDIKPAIRGTSDDL